MQIEQKKEIFRQYYDSNIDFLKDASRKFKEIIEAIVENIPTDVIQDRVKNREECIRKFEDKYLCDYTNNSDYQIQERVTDLIGIRIVCLYEINVKDVEQILSNQFEVINKTNKTEKLNETSNNFGYRGLHLDLRIKSPRNELPDFIKYKDLQFEVQIRTVTMHAWSAIEHRLFYKQEEVKDRLLKRRINRLSALFELADEEFTAIQKSLFEIYTKPLTDELPINENTFENVLNINYFDGYIRARFRDYPFISDEISRFFANILTYSANYNRESFKQAMSQNFRRINQYKNESQIAMNPYDIVRHILYCSDKDIFKGILYSEQKLSFDTWLESSI